MYEKKPKIEIWLELETRCNLNCKFCFNFWKDGHSKAPMKLSTQDTLKGLEKLFGVVECEKISISGGEPLLREDIFEILRFIQSYEIPMILTTNGIGLDTTLIARFMEAGISTFQIPFHSANQKTHNFLSGVDCWKDTLEVFVLLKENAATLIPVFVATSLNLNHLIGVMELCNILDINEIIFNRFVPG